VSGRHVGVVAAAAHAAFVREKEEAVAHPMPRVLVLVGFA